MDISTSKKSLKHIALRFIIFTMTVVVASLSHAQTFSLVSLESRPNDLTATTQQRLDLNGRKCGLVKVQCVLEGIKFYGNIIGEAVYKDGEYWVYMTDGSKQLSIRHPKLLPLDIDLFTYLHSEIKSGNTYCMSLSIPEALYYSILNQPTSNVPIQESDAPVADAQNPTQQTSAPVKGSDSEQRKHEEEEASNKLDPVIQNLINNMVYVEGGSFMMGSDDYDAHSDEKPVHRESVGSFSIGKYEVTQKEWETVMGTNPPNFKGDNLPVTEVSWDDCQEFIRKLNARTGRNFRLPTEAEWEYAARGGNRSNGYRYSGSNDINSVAWYGDNSGHNPHEVGTKAPNELGLYDMSGNVWEWTSSNYCDDYSEPRNSSNFVLRGGNWIFDASYCRVSVRDDRDHADPGYSHGLRLAL